ncbi:hypothetical protein ACNTMW_18140 [Planosporangium sp. 12N6]|uniref:hypothetical protein n=1 Tax=Planosporangium spinosum TaxID=3402278 RepID=UPI003CEC57D8
MSEHTPQHDIHHPDSTVDPGAHVRVDPTQTDLVAGDPPVPLTVWRTARTPADTGRGIGARLAARLISSYSRPGEAVVDLTDNHALTHACVAGGRRHHPAWFTDASSIVIGPAATVDGSATAGRLGEEDDPPELSAWFGDDLTDPDLPPTGPVADLPPGGCLQGATSLVVARWPLDEVDAANRVRLAWLLAACARLLRPGGCLILVVAVPAGVTATPQDFSGVVQAAAGVGLGYLQHIVAVTADSDGDAFVYHVTDEELLALAGTAGQQWAVAHLRVHADLLVFSHPQLSAGSRRLKGSQDEPKGRSGGSSGSLPGGSS